MCSYQEHDASFDQWERISVDSWEVLQTEQQGSEGAKWLIEESGNVRRYWLHKDVRNSYGPLSTGEDWAEIASTELAGHLSLPCALTRLCSRAGRRGSISLSVVPQGFDLYDGQTWLLEHQEVEGYLPYVEGMGGQQHRAVGLNRPGHTLSNICASLTDVKTPPGSDLPSELTSFDSFAGYLVLDAIIANRDRHEQNWAILIPRLTGPSIALSPSYDHAGALGYNLQEYKYAEFCRDATRLEKFATKGTAHRFEHAIGQKPPTLVELAARAIEMCSPVGRSYWRDRIQTLSVDLLVETLQSRRVDGMSVAAVNFASALIQLNLRRLRDVV